MTPAFCAAGRQHQQSYQTAEDRDQGGSSACQVCPPSAAASVAKNALSQVHKANVCLHAILCKHTLASSHGIVRCNYTECIWMCWLNHTSRPSAPGVNAASLTVIMRATKPHSLDLAELPAIANELSVNWALCFTEIKSQRHLHSNALHFVLKHADLMLA